MKRILFVLALIVAFGPREAFADMPAVCFDSACTYGVQIPGIDDWRQTNIYEGNNGSFGGGFEGAFSHQWHLETMIVGVGSPSSQAASLNGDVTEDFDLIGFLHSLNDSQYTIITDQIASSVEFSPYIGEQFIHPTLIYGFKFNVKL